MSNSRKSQVKNLRSVLIPMNCPQFPNWIFPKIRGTVEEVLEHKSYLGVMCGKKGALQALGLPKIAGAIRGVLEEGLS